MRVPAPSGRGSDTSRSMPHRNAASVLPDPVGARVSVWSPPAMAGQPWDWAGVGAGKLVSNQARTAGENREASTRVTLQTRYDREPCRPRWGMTAPSARTRRTGPEIGSRPDRTARGAGRAGGQAPRPLLACVPTLPHRATGQTPSQRVIVN